MTEKKFAVVFDTNSYRKFVSRKSSADILSITAKLREVESKKNIQAYGSVIVGMEMLGNLVEGEDGLNYNDCLNGIIAMANHCFDEAIDKPRIIPQSYLLIANSFFNVTHNEIFESEKNRVENLGGVINDFKSYYEKAIQHHKSKSTFEYIKNYIEGEEIDFSRQIVNLIDGAKQEILNKHPKIASKQLRSKLLDYIENGPYETSIALAIIYVVAATLGIQLSKDEVEKRASSMKSEFPLSVGFFKWISYKIVNDNIDMQSKKSKQKRWNWLWDYHVSFVISNSTLDNREVILVTSDSDLTEMLKDFGYKNKVLDLSQYLSFCFDKK